MSSFYITRLHIVKKRMKELGGERESVVLEFRSRNEVEVKHGGDRPNRSAGFHGIVEGLEHRERRFLQRYSGT